MPFSTPLAGSPGLGGTPIPVNTTTSIRGNPVMANDWLGQQPWYQDYIRSNQGHFGAPQRLQLLNAATRAGINLGDNYGINSHGQFESTTTPAAVNIALGAMLGWAGGTALSGIGSSGASAGAANTGATSVGGPSSSWYSGLVHGYNPANISSAFTNPSVGSIYNAYNTANRYYRLANTLRGPQQQQMPQQRPPQYSPYQSMNPSWGR